MYPALPVKVGAVAVTGTKAGPVYEMVGLLPSKPFVHETATPSIVATTIPPTCLALIWRGDVP